MLVKTASATTPISSDELPADDGRQRPAANSLERPDGVGGALAGRLPELLAGRAGPLLIGISVYREPADRNAVLFQVGLPDRSAARASDPLGPAPPYRPPGDLAQLIAACVQGGLVSRGEIRYDAAAGGGALFVDQGVAAELRRLLATAGRHPEVAVAHRRAAQYWQWRAAAWPQGRRGDIHDLLEARQHLLDAGDAAPASELTGAVCAQLHAWGELGRETELIQATLDAMPSPSAGRAGWLQELGAMAQAGGDHVTAECRYLQAAQMSARVGDASGVARGHESLGVLARARGDYRRADRHYREAATARQQRLRPPAPTTTEATPAPAPAPAGRPGRVRRRRLSGRTVVLTALALIVVAPAAGPLVIARAADGPAGRAGRPPGSAAAASPSPPATARVTAPDRSALDRSFPDRPVAGRPAAGWPGLAPVVPWPGLDLLVPWAGPATSSRGG
jgi:hypothetical protein